MIKTKPSKEMSELNKMVKEIIKNKNAILENFTRAYVAHLGTNIDIRKLVLVEDRSEPLKFSYYFEYKK